MTKTFCALPFTHLQLRNGGTFGMCCMAVGTIKDGETEYRFGEHSANEVFNSEYLTSARRAMAEGDKVSACSMCYREEATRGASYRTHSNTEFLKAAGKTADQVIAEARHSHFQAPYRPATLHLNLSNLCNLRCRMCWAGNSSEIENDPVHRRWAPADSAPEGSRKELIAEKRAFFRDNKESVEDLLGDVTALREVYFTGGEPMLMPSVQDAMNHLISKGVAGDITLKLNTNATAAQRATIDAMKQFGRVVINLSLDGVGDCYEYIRFPARWKKVEENIDRLMREFPDATFQAAPTVQIYNVFGLVELVDFCEPRGIKIHAQPLYGPRYLAVTILPQEIRDEAADLLRERGALPSIETHLRKAVSTQSGDPVLRFMTFTNDLDKSRGQDFRVTHGRIAEALERHGFAWSDDTRFHGEAKPAPAAPVQQSLTRRFLSMVRRRVSA